jgi:signal peptidase II
VRMMNSRYLLLNLGRGAVIGGAASNALDRIRLGAVVDYAVFQRQGLVVAFNLADIAVVLGAAVLIGGAAFYTLTGRWTR